MRVVSFRVARPLPDGIGIGGSPDRSRRYARRGGSLSGHGSPAPPMDRIHVYPYPNTFRDFDIRAPDADGQEGGDEDKPDIVPGQ